MKKKLLIVFLLIVISIASYPLWKPYAKRNKWFVIAGNVAQDSLRRYGLSSRQIGQRSTIAMPESEIPASLSKIRSIYEQYLRHSGWDAASVAGKRVFELGPGYTIGVPLMFAADGADFVAGLDKFVPLQDGADFQLLYSRMRDTFSVAQKAAFDRTISLRPKIALNPQHAVYIDHKELTDCVKQLTPGTYDMIVSNAVMEEIYDPMPVLRAQDALLRPGGVMVHRIDLRDYGMFSKYGFHALEFLTVPDWIYRRMVESSGQPDRRMIDYYRDIGTSMGYQTEIYITKVLGSNADLPEPQRVLRPGIDYTDRQLNMVREIRPRLIERYRKLPDVDLLAASILFVGRKPGLDKEATTPPVRR
jgi:SAM-dependent methyltransferase